MTTQGEGEEFTVSDSSVTCFGARCRGRRAYQEDTLSVKEIRKGCTFMGVYDGHGGALCSKICKERIHCKVIQQLTDSVDPQIALRVAFLETHTEFIEETDDLSGSCACAVLLYNGILHIANVGDCRAVLGSSVDGSTIQSTRLTNDQKPDREDERERITAAGGVVETGAGGVWRVKAPPWPSQPGTMRLAVSRAIGDRAFGDLVPAEPELDTHQLCQEDQFIVIASDGVWDKMTDDDVCEHVRGKLADGAKLDDISSSLVLAAFAAGSGDNMTAIVGIFKHGS